MDVGYVVSVLLIFVNKKWFRFLYIYWFFFTKEDVCLGFLMCYLGLKYVTFRQMKSRHFGYPSNARVNYVFILMYKKNNNTLLLLFIITYNEQLSVIYILKYIKYFLYISQRLVLLINLKLHCNYTFGTFNIV